MQSKNSNYKSGSLLIVASVFIILAGIKIASIIVTPMVLSVFIATISSNAMLKLEKFGMPRFLAYLSVLLIVFAIIVSFGHILSSSVDKFLSNAPLYKNKIITFYGSLQDIFANMGISITQNDLSQNLDPSGIINYAGSFIKSISAVISKSFLILFMVTFILLELPSIKDKINHIYNKGGESCAFAEFDLKINNYFAIKTIISLITGGFIAIGLLFLRVDFALLLGVIAFLLNYVPSIGSIIAAIPALLVASIHPDGSTVIWVLMLYLFTNVIMGNIVEPKFMGKELGLSVVFILFSLILWGYILGPIGMFMAVPIAMTIKIALQTNQETKNIAILLSDYSKNVKVQ